MGATLAEQVVVQIVPAPSRIVSAPCALQERQRERERKGKQTLVNKVLSYTVQTYTLSLVCQETLLLTIELRPK